MEARAKLFGHPIHQMLIVFPLGLLATAIVFDVIRLATRNGYWGDITFWLIAAGVIGGLIAAPFGLLDWMKIPAGTRAKRIGRVHGLGNVLVLLLFATSWVLRMPDPRAPTMLALLLAVTGAALSLVTGWLGGELVDRLGVGVDDGAHLNAPNSLRRRPDPVEPMTPPR